MMFAARSITIQPSLLQMLLRVPRLSLILSHGRCLQALSNLAGTQEPAPLVTRSVSSAATAGQQVSRTPLSGGSSGWRGVNWQQRLPVWFGIAAAAVAWHQQGHAALADASIPAKVGTCIRQRMKNLPAILHQPFITVSWIKASPPPSPQPPAAGG